jgi:hypothetical protein
LRAQIQQSGEAADAGHGEVEQNQIYLAVALEQIGDLIERAGLADLDLIEQAGHRFPQRAAEQRMIVGDHQAMSFTRSH